MGRELEAGNNRMAARKKKRPPRQSKREPVGLRIIGGKHRGRKLAYSGDRRVRPMKDRLREAIFNLVGPSVKEKHAVDLFAGTGALGLEAISRGAARATFIEQHFPTAKILRQNVATLEIDAQVEVVTADVFIWSARTLLPTTAPWLVFCSPPWDFFVDRSEQILEMLGRFHEGAPAESIMVVESDDRFDFDTLPDPTAWDVRTYRPAVVGIYRKPA